MLPQIVLLTLPVPALLLLLLITAYHLTPLLLLLPNIHLVPLLHCLSKIIPHPRRNLPREFFNLPPRPGSPSNRDSLAGGWSANLGLRGKLVLLLAGQGLVSLVFGWVFLVGQTGWWACAISVKTLPSTILILAVFSIFTPKPAYQARYEISRIRGILLAGGGITHSTLYRRIFPFSLVPTGIFAALIAAVPLHAGRILIATSSLLTVCIITLSAVGGYKAFIKPERGTIRLRETSPYTYENAEEKVKAMRDGDSWVSSPSRMEDANLSSFSFTPSYETPKESRTKPRSTNTRGSPTSWLSSPTATPDTIPHWDLTPRSDHLHSPAPAITRPRSPRSPSPNPNLPQPIHPTPQTSKASQQTHSSYQTGTPGGSIIAGYSPDVYHPLPPRGFASLTSYPLSPSQLHLPTVSRTSLTARIPSSIDAITFIPEERTSDSIDGSSTWTLGLYHSAMENHYAPETPKAQTLVDRRAPPPPPMPEGMPLPPTPTAARSETVFEWHAGRESGEALVGDRGDWVEVAGGEEGVNGWSEEGRGVGIVALLSVVICYVLTMPLFINGLTTTTQSLFLLSLLIPSPLLVIASYLLRYRPLPPRRVPKSSTASTAKSSHQSLALKSTSQLSIPISTSPKLTPPNPRDITRPNSAPPARLSKLLEPKPSISNFGYDKPSQRPHTVYGSVGGKEDERARKMLARRSGDVWLEEGHAVLNGGLMSRAKEMIKPVPALRVLEDNPNPRPASQILNRLKGGVSSLLNRQSVVASEEREMDVRSPIAISITSPSKFERRNRDSGVSMITGECEGDETEGGETVMPSAEIFMAKRGRMSNSPAFMFSRSESGAVGEEGYEVDWLTAGVLPGLVPTIKIGSDIRVHPRPMSEQFALPFDTSIGSIYGDADRTRHSLDMSTPHRSQSHSHSKSSSIDYTTSDMSFYPDSASQSTPHARQIRQRGNKGSLPNFQPTNFEDVRRSIVDVEQFDDARGDVEAWGVDLPPIPHGLASGRNPSTTRIHVGNETNESSRMRHTLADMGDAILALSATPKSTHSTSRLNLTEFGPALLNPELVGSISISEVSTGEYSQMAEEMEQVLGMDTPTRAEFVISPPASSVGGDSRPGSRASTTTASDGFVPPVPAISGRFSNSTRDGESTRWTIPLADILNTPKVIPLPTLSHPHPPPIPTQIITHQTSMPNFSRPQTISAPHPPINPPSTLLSKQSSSTIHSNYTQSDHTHRTTSSTTSDEYFSAPVQPFQPSREELNRVEQLRLRAVASGEGLRSKSVMGLRGEGKTKKATVLQSRGLKPLQLVELKKANRLSAPLPVATGMGTKRVLVLQEGERGGKGSGRGSERGKGSVGDKENMRPGEQKASKASTGSGGHVIRV